MSLSYILKESYHSEHNVIDNVEGETMERYDYYEAVKNDAINAILENINWNEDYLTTHDENDIYDDLWIDDSVTGNASGSYTFSTWEAEENVCHNLDLLGEALYEFGCDASYLAEHGAEAADVTIRCYVLGQVIGEAMEEVERIREEAEEA